MEEVSLQELFYIFKNKILLIIGITLIALGISGIISFYIIKPEYETFTTLIIGNSSEYQLNDSGIEYNDILLNRKLVHTYGELVKSRLVIDKVIDSLDLEISYETFKGKIQVELVNDTEIIKIKVKDNDRELVANIANELSEQFMKTVNIKMRVENIQIIDKAYIQENPISPNKTLNIIIGSVIGFMIGVFLTLLLEYLNNTFKTPEDVEKNLNLPVLGIIPTMNSDTGETIVKDNAKSPISESFRTMRTNIQFTNIDKDTKTLAITSTVPNEGKSFIVSNLAISIAQGEKRVLLVDCDLRKPKLHKIFGVLNTIGLTNILMGAFSLEDSLLEIDDIEGLALITSGPIPPNPSELLNSYRMKDFLELVKREYDIVIIDTPPIGFVTDGAIVSTLTDGTLLVIESHKTEIGQVQYAKELLDKVNANIIGGILNKVDLKKGEYGNFIYDQYDSYYEQNHQV